MNEPTIVWCMIAGVLLCVFILRATLRYSYACRHRSRRHLIEMGKDKDIFYVPGDVEGDDDCDDL